MWGGWGGREREREREREVFHNMKIAKVHTYSYSYIPIFRCSFHEDPWLVLLNMHISQPRNGQNMPQAISDPVITDNACMQNTRP